MDPFIKAMFGCHAIHAPCQTMAQDQGRTKDGKYITLLASIVVTDEPFLSKEAREVPECCHELIVGDMVIRPQGKWAVPTCRGNGITSIITSSAMFPETHEIQTLDNGYKPRKKEYAN